MNERGVPFERAKVGDRYVLEQLQSRGWLFGGENSGHLLALDCHSTGDGTISALQVLAAVVRTGQDPLGVDQRTDSVAAEDDQRAGQDAISTGSPTAGWPPHGLPPRRELGEHGRTF